MSDLCFFLALLAGLSLPLFAVIHRLAKSRFHHLRGPILEHLAIVARCGLPLGPGLLALARERSGKSHRQRRDAEFITDLAARLETEGTLASALATAPAVFPAAWVELIRQGEGHGALPETLAQLDQEEREREEQGSRVQEWLAYPATVAVMVGAVTLFLVAVILPKMVELDHAMVRPPMQQLRLELAVGAAALLFGSITLGSLAGAALSWRGRLADALTRAGHAVGYRLPWAGRSLRQQTHARWLRRTGRMLQAGATWSESLSSAAGLERGRVGADVQAAGQLAREGQALKVVLERALGRDAPALLPTLLLVLGREEAQGLGAGLVSAGQRMSERAQARLKTVGEAARPAPLLFLAAVVACQVYAVWGFIVSMQGQLVRSVF